jgi:hypothetical protein
LNVSANAAIGDGSAAGTIIDDDGEPALSIGDVTVTEGNSGTMVALFSVGLSAPSGKTVSVNYATSPGTAAESLDYQEASDALTFSPGQTSKTVSVLVLGDGADEANETFQVDLSGAVNAAISDSQGIGTIIDDDGPALAINDVSVGEAAGSAVFTVSLAGPSPQTVTVNYGTSHVGTSGADFSGALAGTVTFDPGETTETVSLGLVNDSIDELNETFQVNLSGAANASISDAQGIGTIIDDDGPVISINDVTTSGESGNATFTVSLSATSPQQIQVQFATAPGTASAGSDYTATSGTLTIPPNTASAAISVPIVGDSIDEQNEAFFLNLSNATNAAIGDNQGQGTITDDDAAPSLSINDQPSLAESGVATYTVTLTPASGQPVTVNFGTANGDVTAPAAPAATAPADYEAQTGGLLSFAPGETTKTILVPISADTLDEANEKFSVTLSNVSATATISDGTGIGTIVDDDTPPTVSIASVEPVPEGIPSVFNVTLSSPSGQQVTVQYATSNGTAVAPDDYTAVPATTLTFAPGEVAKQVSVATINDTLDEPAETLTVTLTSPGNATLGTPSATGTINDNDDPPTLAINDRSALEGNSGGLGTCGPVPAPGTTPQGFAPFTVTLSAASGQSVTVQWSTANGTAIASGDYAAVPATTLTFAPGGALSQTVCVKINGDTSDEPNETFSVVLTNATNATLADAVGVGTILDDDGEPALTVTGASDPESGAARFVVSLLPSSGNVVTVDLLTVGGTAVAGADFAPIPAGVSPGPPASCSANPCTLTFNAGQSSKAIDVNLVNDTLDEDNEAFTVRLSNEQNAKVLNGNDRIGFVTILDDDGPPSVSIGDATVTEGNSETVNANFQLTLSAVSGRTISVDYAAVNGSAVSPEDYVASSGTISFAPGETSKNAVVPVNGESSFEGDETFAVSLSSPVNVAIGDGEGIGTIINDDTPPQPPPPPPPPPPGPPPPDGGSGTTTTPTGSGPTTTSPTTTRPPTTGQGPPTPQTFTGMGISGAPVTLLDNFAAIGVTCSKKAKGTCVGKLEIIARGAGRRKGRALAIVNGQVKRVTTGAVTYGREAFAIPRGRTEKVLVGLSRRGVRAVRQRGRLLVTVVATAKDSAGKRAKPVRRSLWLQAPRTVRKLPAPK